MLNELPHFIRYAKNVFFNIGKITIQWSLLKAYLSYQRSL